jgi:hypothetical protein
MRQNRLERLRYSADEGRQAGCSFVVVGAAVVLRVIRRGRCHPGRLVIVRIDRLKRWNLRGQRQELRSSDYLETQMTRERADGHLRQGARLQPVIGYLAPLDQAQRRRSGHRKRSV